MSYFVGRIGTRARLSISRGGLLQQIDFGSYAIQAAGVLFLTALAGSVPLIVHEGPRRDRNGWRVRVSGVCARIGNGCQSKIRNVHEMSLSSSRGTSIMIRSACHARVAPWLYSRPDTDDR